LILTCKAKVKDCCIINGKLYFEIQTTTKKEGIRLKWINYESALDYHKEVERERLRT
jgi:hypothetical protein